MGIIVRSRWVLWQTKASRRKPQLYTVDALNYVALADSPTQHSSPLMHLISHPRKRFVCKSIGTPRMYTLGLSGPEIMSWQNTDSPLLHAHPLEQCVHCLWVCGLQQFDCLVVELCRYLWLEGNTDENTCTCVAY